MIRPVLTIIAGANGAGKSTLTRMNAVVFEHLPLLDPDAVANTLQQGTSGGSALAAGRQVLEQAARCLKDRQSFAVETTLAGKNYLRMMESARAAGFEVVLIYIGTDSVETNLTRIENRVRRGGHAVPPEDVRRRYGRSLEHLRAAVELAERTILFDNSSEAGYQLVGVHDAGRWTWFAQLPAWVRGIGF